MKNLTGKHTDDEHCGVVEETESILELYFRLEYDEREDTAKCKDICAADNNRQKWEEHVRKKLDADRP